MLKEFLTSIADKLRELLGTADTINAQNFTSKIDDVYDTGYEKGKSEGGGSPINPEWTDWRYFSCYNNRNNLVAKLKYSDTSNGTNFSYMFTYCSELVTIPQIDTSKGTNFGYMFDNCSYLSEIPEMDTSNGTNFSYMFTYCSELVTIPQIDTSKGTNFGSMFNVCRKLTEIPEMDTSKGTNFSYMFRYCNKLVTIPQIDTSKGTNFGSMFNDCTKLVTIPKLNMSSMTKSSSMSDMFRNCSLLENVTFEGTINITQNTTVFSTTPKLTVESLMSFINALSDNTGVSTTYTVTIGSTNLAKLTQEQLQVAYDKNIALA